MDDSFKNLISGCFAGIVQTLIGHPLDTIKVSHIKYKSKTISKTISKVYRKNGLRQFYKGIVPPMYSSVISNMGIYFMYNYFKRKKGMSNIVAGAYTGACLGIIEGPTDMIKTKMQIQPCHGASHTRLIKQLGIRGLFQGTSYTIMRNIPAVGGYFWGYETTKSYFKHPVVGSFLGGIAAGFMCWGPTYPIDYIKTKVQIADKPINFFDIIKTTKIRTYWNGFTPCIIRAIMINPFVFLAYESGMKYLLK